MSTVSKWSLGANDDNDDSVMMNVPQAGTLMMLNLMVVVMTMVIMTMMTIVPQAGTLMMINLMVVVMIIIMTMVITKMIMMTMMMIVLQAGTPTSFWLSGFFAHHSFIAAIKQNFARANGCSTDEVTLVQHMMA